MTWKMLHVTFEGISDELLHSIEVHTLRNENQPERQRHRADRWGVFSGGTTTFGQLAMLQDTGEKRSG